jgi:hypothetical protein
MQDERSSSFLYERAQRRLEAAILALLLAEDWPWRRGELATRLGYPPELVNVCVARLRADGLARVGDPTRGDDVIRASWAAVRCNELLRHCPPERAPDRTNVERFPPNHGDGRHLPYRHPNGGDSAPNR